MKVYIVTAEANGVPQTTDGEWFHILGVFHGEPQAMVFQQKVIESGEWGEYEIDKDGRVLPYPIDGSDWQVNLYEEDILETVGDAEVPEGYGHYNLDKNRLATPRARTIRRQLLNGSVPIQTIPDYVMQAMKTRDWIFESSSGYVELFPQARAACADDGILD